MDIDRRLLDISFFRAYRLDILTIYAEFLTTSNGRYTLGVRSPGYGATSQIDINFRCL